MRVRIRLRVKVRVKVRVRVRFKVGVKLTTVPSGEVVCVCLGCSEVGQGSTVAASAFAMG